MKGGARVGDLNRRPDALEYEEAARNLIHGDGCCLRVVREKYPPHYARRRCSRAHKRPRGPSLVRIRLRE